jgi:putative long chain acyl-CoA synthase
MKALGRIGATAQNALEVARFGGLDTGEEPSPYEIALERPVYRLRRYFPQLAEVEHDRPVILLVPPLMLSTEVYDVAPATSAVATLTDGGVDVWVVDFGAPEKEEGGLNRTLTDHVLAVSDAIDEVRKRTGRDAVHLSGYSQGGMFCYQAAALRRAEGLASIITFGSPVDTSETSPIPLPEAQIINLVSGISERVLSRTGLPAWATRTGFRMLDPAKAVRSRVDFLRQLNDRESLLERERQRRFLEADGWVAYPAPAIAELLEQFVVHNRMLSGGFVIDGRVVTLADIDCPMLCFVGTVDEIAPAKAVRAVRRAAPKANIWEHEMRAGHFGLVVGSKSVEETWPTVAAWIHWREGDGQQPEAITPLRESADDANAADFLTRLGHAANLVTDVAIQGTRSTIDATLKGGDALRRAVGGAIDQLPRLNRLEGIRASTRISLGLLLDEHARRAPDQVFFLYDGRGHTYGDAKRRVDNIVRGLISVGVRQGEHVGVLMGTRPSAVAVVAALSRLGAVIVLMRGEGSPEREAQLGQVTRIIADPESADVAKSTGVPVLVLGGGGEPRELGFGLTDMERIDPDAVHVPAWYVANPGRGRDLAFMLFAGVGEATRVNRITNRRWALSAFGTASSAALSGADTVYCVTPISHPSGLLTSIGGAIGGGARIALTSSFDPTTFWEEVRRYGITVVSYTWAMCRVLVDAPVDEIERDHPIRLFMGSGMPTGLWRRVLDRFAPAKVVEFYASTEGEAVLVNLGGPKVGSKGRQLPGSAPVRIAAWDLAAGKLVERDDGFARPCARDEVGMLLAREREDRGGLLAAPVRGVFEKNDEWTITGDLFRRDRDGDYWIVDHVSGVIDTPAGPVPSYPIADALEALPDVDLAVAYGLDGAKGSVVVAAITARVGHDVRPEDLATAVRTLPPASRPSVVRVVDRIPLTTWYRPLKAPLRAHGVPTNACAFAWNDGAQSYEPLTDSARVSLGLPVDRTLF